MGKPSPEDPLKLFEVGRAAGTSYWVDHKGHPHCYWLTAMIDIALDATCEVAVIRSHDGNTGDPTTRRRGPEAQSVMRRRFDPAGLTADMSATRAVADVARHLSALDLARSELGVHYMPQTAMQDLQAFVLGDHGVQPDPAWVADIGPKGRERWLRDEPWHTVLTSVLAYPFVDLDLTWEDMRRSSATTPAAGLARIAVFHALQCVAHASESTVFDRQAIARVKTALEELCDDPASDQVEPVAVFRQVTEIFDAGGWPAGAKQMWPERLFSVAMMAILRWIARRGRPTLDGSVDLQRAVDVCEREPETVPGGLAFRFACGDVIVEEEGDLWVGFARTIDHTGSLLISPCALSDERFREVLWAAAARDVTEAARSIWLHSYLMGHIRDPWGVDAEAARPPMMAELSRMVSPRRWPRRRNPEAERALRATLARMPD